MATLRLRLLAAFFVLWASPALAAPVEEAAALAQRYALVVEAADAPGRAVTRSMDVAWQPASEAGRTAYAPLLVAELGLYPPDLVARSQLRRIVLCSELTSRGRRVSALPAFGQDTLYYDVDRTPGMTGYLTGVIHHEFFHLVDWRDDGLVYEDPAWRKLNPADFAYGNGGTSRLGDSSQSLLTTAFPGFLTAYGTAGVEEDKAELFTHLMCNPAHVARRAEVDPVLRAKVAHLKALLAAFAPGVDGNFWSHVETVRNR